LAIIDITNRVGVRSDRKVENAGSRVWLRPADGIHRNRGGLTKTEDWRKIHVSKQLLGLGDKPAGGTRAAIGISNGIRVCTCIHGEGSFP